MNKITWPILGLLLLLKLLVVLPSYADNSSVPVADGFVFPVVKDEPSDPDEFVFNEADPHDNGWTGNGVGVDADPKLKGHLGQDYFLSKGNTAGKRVYAVADGIVVEVMNSNNKYGWCDQRSHGWGRVIVIKHEAPPGAFFDTDGSIVSQDYVPKDSRHPGSTEKNPTIIYTLYGHLSKEDLDVKRGDTVKKGQPIARIGSSVEVSEFPIAWTPHLHFEIKSQDGFEEGVWDKENPGKHLEHWCKKNHIKGIGSGYSYISGYAPERYDPSVFITNNTELTAVSDRDNNSIEDYFLFSKKGSVWHYNIKSTKLESRTMRVSNGGESEFQGNKAIVYYHSRKDTNGNTTYNGNIYYQYNGQELYIIGGEAAGTVPVKFQPPILKLKNPLHVGSKWDYRASMINLNTGEASSTLSGHGLVENEEQITVPAGTFNAIKVKIVQEQIFNNHPNLTIIERLWLAKGVGIVRKESNFEQIELTHYSIPDKPLPTSDKIVIRSRKGEVTVDNFFKTATTSGSGYFTLIDATNFSIGYFGPDSSFTITLKGKPVQDSRDKAEETLLDILEISKADACKLIINLGVPGFVDKTLAGKNYGLSFCPDGIAFRGSHQIADDSQSSETAEKVKDSSHLKARSLGEPVQWSIKDSNIICEERTFNEMVFGEKASVEIKGEIPPNIKIVDIGVAKKVLKDGIQYALNDCYGFRDLSSKSSGFLHVPTTVTILLFTPSYDSGKSTAVKGVFKTISAMQANEPVDSDYTFKLKTTDGTSTTWQFYDLKNNIAVSKPYIGEESKSFIQRLFSDEDYFPLSDGSNWKYEDLMKVLPDGNVSINKTVIRIDGQENINQKSYYKLIEVSSGLPGIEPQISFVRKATDGIFRVEGNYKDKPEYLWRPNKLTIGTAWTVSYLGAQVHHLVVAKETAELFDKKFENCLKVSYEGIHEGVVFNGYYYLAPGIGMVKKVFVIQNLETGISIKSERVLESYEK